jgi:hypothetical protein
MTSNRSRSASIVSDLFARLRSPRLYSVPEASDSKAEASSPTLTKVEIDESDPSKGTPTGWSIFNPEIRVRVCHAVPQSQERVRDLMFDCAQYQRWWPKTYSFDVERCTPETVDSVIHFKSPVGHYKCRLTDAAADANGVVRLRQNYFEGILHGDMEWQITRLSDSSCNLCYDAALKPTSISAQIAAAVSSREYLASYFEPLVVSLKAELVRQDAAHHAAAEAAAVAIRTPPSPDAPTPPTQ